MAQCILISRCGMFEITHLLGDATYSEKVTKALNGKKVKPTYREPRLFICIN